MVDYLDRRINEINKNSLEETNRSKYIRLLIRKDMQNPQHSARQQPEARPNQNAAPSGDLDFYHSLLQLGGYKR